MITHPNFDPVAFSVGPVAVHWYGLAYLCGFAVGVGLGIILARRASSGWTTDDVWDLLFYTAVGVIVGGRLGYVLFYGFDNLISDPLYLFKVWSGGMSFHGGLVGVVIALLLYARSRNRSLLAVGDFIAPLCPAGLGIGRVANFVNQELWGRTSDVSWAVLFPKDPSGMPRHPSQLYEAALEGVVLFLVVLWFVRVQERKANPVPGRIAGLFLLGYGLSRILVEFFREPDLHIGFIAWQWVTMGQILSVPMVILGLFLLLRPGR